jgi:hypothetical protein
MPRQDTFHVVVKNALVKDGWRITHDPYKLEYNRETLYVDLGAEAPIGAEKEGHKIAVEIKSFLGKSGITDLYHALGQYVIYRALIESSDPERILYLAMPIEAYDTILNVTEGQALISKETMKLVLYIVEEERIERWIE